MDPFKAKSSCLHLNIVKSILIQDKGAHGVPNPKFQISSMDVTYKFLYFCFLKKILKTLIQSLRKHEPHINNYQLNIF